jgi:hypothetical protein
VNLPQEALKRVQLDTELKKMRTEITKTIEGIATLLNSKPGVFSSV